MTDTLQAARVVRIDVRGMPRPQGSMQMRALPNGGATGTYPAAVWHWRHQVQQAVAEVVEQSGRFEGPVELRLGFDLPRPLGHFGTGRNAGTIKASAPPHPAVMPDLDKLIRAICDSITDAGLWRDDSQVCSIQAGKRYTTKEPGVYVTVTELT
jgi:Holliday junction resolvase RusA-like endonuclease